jgi:hypothetical protein
VPAGPPAYLVIQPDGSSTVRGTPEAAPPPAAPSLDSTAPAGPAEPSAPVGAVPDAGGD